MPAVSLLPEQKERVETGLCACGCGVTIPKSWYGPTSYYSSPACKQKAYRQRQQAGAVVGKDERERERLRVEAAGLRQQEKEIQARISQLQSQLKAVQEQADRLEKKAAGQLELFTCAA